MKEVSGDLWKFMPEADLRVITTNGTVRKDGRAVMGKGCALEAVKIFPSLDKKLGERLTRNGNVVQIFNRDNLDSDFALATFPVKHYWRDNADKDLIIRSAIQLSDLVDYIGFKNIVLPRPGCGAGNLNWKEVKPLISRLLDNRFHVITWG